MKRPNILLVYTDQQRWDALGVNGNGEIISPNLDALAARGTNFSRHFVQNPVCMPSRVSMLSSQYPSTLRITHMGVPVPQDLMTLPRLLKQYGYRTANIGKLHFLPHANRDHRQPHPSYGFDVLEVADEPGVYEDAYRAWVRRQAPDQMDAISAGLPPNTSVWQRAMGIDDGIKHRGEPQGRHDFKRAIPFAADDHLTYSAFVGARTTEFIEAAGAEPFFCIASFYSPHAPWIAPQTYLDMYDANGLSLPEYPAEIDRRRPADPNALCSDEQLRSAKQGYYAMISEVDYYVGRILDALDKTGKREETIIVFTSDHGEWLGDHLRFGKGYPADDAVSRVPLIISAPGAPEARQYDGIVEAVDIVPTLLELAAIQTPPFMQGESLANLIMGQDVRRKRAALTEGTGWKSLRIPRFRYLIHADGRESLWDLALDPGAYHDLAEEPGYEGELTACRRYLLTRLLEMERPRERTWTY
ncbi:MAG: sulfatase-like hydrolase/transferase [Chloroflexota bacterium]|nr:sulfatase-like hydrolase/transferase [Chloroflexota bacterium]MDE2910140.1 sulfatase-like hydrolase/transferase [Chloroflexota bacterium]